MMEGEGLRVSFNAIPGSKQRKDPAPDGTDRTGG